MVAAVRDTARTLKLHEQAINPDLVGAHSLRAGGAMALKLHGYDDTTIMKMGRWTSLTFLQYIHNQIAHLSKDISTKIGIAVPFVNVTAFKKFHPIWRPLLHTLLKNQYVFLIITVTSPFFVDC